MIVNKLSEINKILGGELCGTDAEITNLSTDSRTILSGELFLALKGEHYDGHDYLDLVNEKGAAGAIVSKKIHHERLPLIIVPDTLLALGKLASFQRDHFQLPLFGITGSCGKTTTKAMLTSILAQQGTVLSPQSSYNNAIGLPLTLLKLNDTHNFCVLELGANHSGEIAYLTAIAKPHVAIITNIAPVHLEGFGDIDGVAAAKSEIFMGLDPKGIAIINYDDDYRDQLMGKAAGKKIITFGRQAGADVSAQDIKLTESGEVNFQLKIAGESIDIHLPTLGEHHVMNALAAASAAYAIGIATANIKKGLENVPQEAKRLIKWQGLNGAEIIDDSYNANLLAAKAALQVLANSKGEKLFIFGGMAELGDKASDHHQLLGEYARELGVNYLFGWGDLSRITTDAFGAGGTFFEDKQSLIEATRSILHPNMTVLVKGSRSAKMEEVVNSLILATKESQNH